MVRIEAIRFHSKLKSYYKPGDALYVEKRLPRVIAVSSNPAELDMLKRQISTTRLKLLPFSEPQFALETLQEKQIEVVLVDEDLEQGSGLDFLLECRQHDVYTSLVLLADENHELDLAVDAVNRACISKLLTKPWDVDEIVDELEDAAARYSRDIRKDRHLTLSDVRVKRLTTTVEQTRRNLALKTQQLSQLKKMPVLIGPGQNGTDSSLLGHSAANDSSSFGLSPTEGVVELLSDMIMANDRDGASQRIRQLTEGCAKLLRWPSDEIDIVSFAATIHHALLPLFPDESQVEISGGNCQHALELGQRLALLPGMSAAAQIIGAHHRSLFDSKGKPVSAPRGARLLQIISLFDELCRDETSNRSEEVAMDPDLGLTRASEAILQLGGRKLAQDLCEICIKSHIPQLLGRDEQCLSVDQIEVGMTLSRTVYAENLALVRSGLVLTQTAMDKIKFAAQKIQLQGIWVSNDDLTAEVVGRDSTFYDEFAESNEN